MIKLTLAVVALNGNHFVQLSPNGCSPAGPDSTIVFQVSVGGEYISLQLSKELTDKARQEAESRSIEVLGL